MIQAKRYDAITLFLIDKGFKKHKRIDAGKEKIDMLRRRKTGGGPAPPPSLTASEDALMQAFDGRPQDCGRPDGIDTDANDGNMNNNFSFLKSSHYRSHTGH